MLTNHKTEFQDIWKTFNIQRVVYGTNIILSNAYEMPNLKFEYVYMVLCLLEKKLLVFHINHGIKINCIFFVFC